MDLKLKLDNYFRIVIRNLKDIIPKIIGNFLMRQFIEFLEVNLLRDLSEFNYCIDNMKEDDKLKNQREMLKKQLASLTKADNILMNYIVVDENEEESLRRKFNPTNLRISGIYKDEVEPDELENYIDKTQDFYEYAQRQLSYQEREWAVKMKKLQSVKQREEGRQQPNTHSHRANPERVVLEQAPVKKKV